MTKSATFSEDRSKRFDLIRDWRDEIGAPQKTMVLAMLNPSKAGEKDDDPTVRKGVGFARRWGFGRLVVVNLEPTVSTDPWELPSFRGIDMHNRAVIQGWIGEADTVVAAWGTQPPAICRRIALQELIYLFKQIAPVDLYCIGETAKGSPLHPSRAAYTMAPRLWRAYEDSPAPALAEKK